MENKIDEISNNNINLSCYTEYSNYKKKLIKNIFEQLNIIYDLFDEKINDDLVKIFILFKKNKINIDVSNQIKVIFDFINYLNSIKFIDQYEFLNIILKMILIYDILLINYKYFSEYEYKNHFDYDNIINKFKTVIDILSSKNIILDILLNLSKTDNKKIFKKKFKILAIKLSNDFFFYYSASNIIKIINKNFKMIKNNNNFYKFLKEYTNCFKDEYKKNSLRYLEFYDSDNTLKIKFCYNVNNNKFCELINDFTSLKNL
jgi:hypothetical protein